MPIRLPMKKGRAGTVCRNCTPKKNLGYCCSNSPNVRIGLEIQTTGMPGRRWAIRNEMVTHDNSKACDEKAGSWIRQSIPCPYTPVGTSSQLSHSRSAILLKVSGTCPPENPREYTETVRRRGNNSDFERFDVRHGCCEATSPFVAQQQINSLDKRFSDSYFT